MAMFNTSEYQRKINKKRKGVHAKTKTSSSKGSKLYKKVYNGQGK